MFKKILLASVLGALVLPVSSVKAQWEISGSNIFYDAGYVGIGTSAPASRLDVANGDISLDNNQAYRIYDPAGTARVMFLLDNLGNQVVGASTMSTGGDMQLRVPSFATGAVTIKAYSGNVGIGTTSPGNKLTVGDSGLGFGLGTTASIGNNSGFSSLVIGQDTLKQGILFWDPTFSKFNISSGYSLILQKGGGKVGIGTGTDTPSAMLEVRGTIATSGSSGTVTTQVISVPNLWYSQAVTFPYAFVSAPRVTLTQENSGSGDISIISLRVKKNSVTANGFTIDYYVNAIPTSGTTKFNWTAFK